MPPRTSKNLVSSLFAETMIGYLILGKTACYFSLTDEECNGILKSAHLDPVIVNQLFPHPIKYQEVWSQKQGNSKFFAWRAISPSPDFVPLGMIGTTTPEEPSLQDMRCVPLRFLKEVKDKPKKIWDDSGTGGRAGSFWSVSSMCLLWVTQGHEAPKGPFYELVKDKVMCSLGVDEKAPPPKGYAPPGSFVTRKDDSESKVAPLTQTPPTTTSTIAPPKPITSAPTTPTSTGPKDPTAPVFGVTKPSGPAPVTNTAKPGVLPSVSVIPGRTVLTKKPEPPPDATKPKR